MTDGFKQTVSVVLVFFGVMLITNFSSVKYAGFASLQNETSITSDSLDLMPGNNTRIVLVHGAVSDGSIWSKVIPILTDAGYRVIAAQLPLHSLENDVITVERAVERIGGPAILVRHSYGGEVITNADYNNPNVTGLVYIAALAPDAGETGNDLFEQLPEVVSQQLLETFSENTELDSAGFLYFKPDKFHELVVQDVDPTEAEILAAVQKPFNQSIGLEKSGPPAWKQLPSWYQISENDRLIPPDIQRSYAERMNATTLSLNSSHASLISHPDEIADLIINATKVSDLTQ
ncbi:MAG TPA: alpha/beta hydrolase [Nitrososphaeraceae archaeon]|nr:alpha/beta hydrolase [Nitrososphaeraceae archaeon]